MTVLDHTPIYTSLAARLENPPTSHAAAPAVGKVWAIQAEILSILSAHGPLTHDQIRRHFLARNGMVPGSSAASIRTRTAELHTLEGVRAVDRNGHTPSGRSATRWDIHREETP
ncbi:hypothetical protein [Brachybacterium sp. SGAir0954]|uniref:hypothetical protein n=1 Tax=Brachybacterium sp. SGAir0954 TaxID=2571029 RepID=UPI00143CEFBF|nr:hypothetical protein [Brachybacterium sp. SGAir0954]